MMKPAESKLLKNNDRMDSVTYPNTPQDSPISSADVTLDVLVVGAGISGLTIAHELATQPVGASQKESLKLLVTEAQDRLGGSIVSVQSPEGFLWEEGPNSFAPTPELLKLAVAVGLKDELLLTDRKLPRFVFWRGKLHPVPMNPGLAITTRLLSLAGKLRALRGTLGFVRPAIAGEESVEKFFKRQLGQEVMQRLVGPFVSGVYAGDPQQLSAAAAFKKIAALEQNYGGLLAGAILSRSAAKKAQPTKPEPDPNIPKARSGELGSFRQGLQALPSAIAAKLQSLQVPVKLQWQLRKLEHDADSKTYTATFATPTGEEIVTARTVVLATPAYVTGALLSDLQPAASQALSEIPYPTVACAVLAYPKTETIADLNGFGNLIPRQQGIRTLGTIWTSSLFAGRAPEGWHLLLNFIGGTTDPELANLTESEIAEAVHQDLRQIILRPNTTVQPKVLAVHIWKKAIPQFAIGHLQRLEVIRQGLQQLPGVFLSSNYIEGVSMGDCVRQGLKTAEQVKQFLG
ncbi:protoporphyrinogen oxidase [Tumidithrix helvetica PCC 7403]|uniref:protoporphyrinogen oxidase n=1 Tax=Tumidithrix helvetica TaxID=3457545 RepID=UPI003C987825